jgi:hypothetical protein
VLSATPPPFWKIQLLEISSEQAETFEVLYEASDCELTCIAVPNFMSQTALLSFVVNDCLGTIVLDRLPPDRDLIAISALESGYYRCLASTYGFDKSLQVPHEVSRS